MKTVRDFEEMLDLLSKHRVRYLIIGGLAFIFHAKPRYTRDMDLWVECEDENVKRANAALSEFGSPELLEATDPEEMLQLGVEPNRIDFLLKVQDLNFDEIWGRRVVAQYGSVEANWIDIDTLIQIKSRIDNPRHQDDARLLREAKKIRSNRR